MHFLRTPRLKQLSSKTPLLLSLDPEKRLPHLGVHAFDLSLIITVVAIRLAERCDRNPTAQAITAPPTITATLSIQSSITIERPLQRRLELPNFLVR